jgi:hypothetical protein
VACRLPLGSSSAISPKISRPERRQGPFAALSSPGPSSSSCPYSQTSWKRNCRMYVYNALYICLEKPSDVRSERPGGGDSRR